MKYLYSDADGRVKMVAEEPIISDLIESVVDQYEAPTETLPTVAQVNDAQSVDELKALLLQILQTNK